jgi:hypothetical protein
MTRRSVSKKRKALNDDFERRYISLRFAVNHNNVTRAAGARRLSRRHRELPTSTGIVERPAEDGESSD